MFRSTFLAGVKSMPEYKRWANSASFLELQILLKIPPQMTAVGKKIIPFSKSYLKLFSIGIGVMLYETAMQKVYYAVKITHQDLSYLIQIKILIKSWFSMVFLKYDF